MLEKFFDKILEETGEIEEEVEEKVEEKVEKIGKAMEKKRKFTWKQILPPLLLFLLAISLRLTYIFTHDPQNAGLNWYSDVYHHWQIGYLTKTVGLKQGFLRLWDLKGMEYFWGALHPLVLVFLFTITGSVSILVPRLLDVFCGGLSVVLLFLVIKRHFNFQAGLAAALLAAVTPVGIFSDASGMQEPLGIVLLLAGFYFWPRKYFLTGFLWALSGMVRAEFWLLSLGLVVAVIIFEKNFDRKIGLLAGYALLTLFHMKILLDRTGNPIYPIWWNFVGNAMGEWQEDIPPTAPQLLGQKVFWLVFGLSFLGVIATLIKKPKFYLFWLLGFGNWLMLGAFVGFTQYLLSYLHRFWVDRIMLWPYMFLGALICVFLFYLVPRYLPLFAKLKINWILVLLILAGSQLAWLPINHYLTLTEHWWEKRKFLAAEIGQVHKEGKILLFEDRPPVVYALVHFEGITGEEIISQMFDPFYYAQEDPFSNWDEFWPEYRDWLKENEISLALFHLGSEDYQKMVKKQPKNFKFLKTRDNVGFYEVSL